MMRRGREEEAWSMKRFEDGAERTSSKCRSGDFGPTDRTVTLSRPPPPSAAWTGESTRDADVVPSLQQRS